MKLYSYWRSSASYRVRIALHLKGISFDTVSVNLKDDEHLKEPYVNNLPNLAVPVLVHHDMVLTQSIAIIEYLEEVYPTPKLLPEHPQDRAMVRSFCQTIACDIHPLNNLKVLRFLENEFRVNPQQKDHWYQNWIHAGFEPLEKIAKKNENPFCFGDAPTMADCSLIPQIYNALRFNVDMGPYPALMNIYNYCMQQDSFVLVSPERQDDYAL